jgi:hypothetical protein
VRQPGLRLLLFASLLAPLLGYNLMPVVGYGRQQTTAQTGQQPPS